MLWSSVRLVGTAVEEFGVDQRPKQRLAARPIHVPQPLSLFDPQAKARHFDELSSDTVQKILGRGHKWYLRGQLKQPTYQCSCVLNRRLCLTFQAISANPAPRRIRGSYNCVDTPQLPDKGVVLSTPAARQANGVRHDKCTQMSPDGPDPAILCKGDFLHEE
jgi:hypothetical protein